jgi:mRNA interferase RelE/StbE
MSKTIVFSVSAARAFGKLPPDVQERLYRALFAYGSQGTGDVKRMAGKPTLRLRVGDYRVIFDERNDALEILVVGNRRDMYR